MGLKLTAEDIYSINHSSLKDGILLFGGGCTGGFVSTQGLLLTNHHCGFGSIQQHSTLEHDYLRNGFWAKNKEEELPNPALSVTLLVRMEDVTTKILNGVNDKMSKLVRDSIITINIKSTEKEALKNTHYEAKTKAFYYGNEYYMFIIEVFKDVRLVGAPPTNIGNFGGDTDNWMWPRHTGDFSVFRVYADKDGKPAAYSKDNVPYTPKYTLPISLKGYEKGDFTFIYGYPGTTQEYLPSYAVQLISETENPTRIKLRTKRLEVIKTHMNESRLVRIQYSAKAANIANGWKKWQGEDKGIKRMDAVGKKKFFESNFTHWITADTGHNSKYSKLLSAYAKTYAELLPLDLSSIYYNEAGNAIELFKFTRSFTALVKLSQDKKTKKEDLDKALAKAKTATEDFFKNYSQTVDHELMPWLLSEYAANCPKEYCPSELTALSAENKGDFKKYSDAVFKESIFASKEKMMAFLNNYQASNYKKLSREPVYSMAQHFADNYTQNIQGKIDVLRNRIDSLNRIYMKAQREMQPSKRFYPDANLTLRIAYGNILDYKPADATGFNYFTTLDGVMQKEDTAVYDYVVDPKLKELFSRKEYGKYADKDGSLHTCFIASNHTTGGNSGSPVFNGSGELIGLNFDRCWEGTMSDIIYDPDQCRNITLDIRYCLFVIDKVCGAGNLVNEMNIRE